MPSTLDATHKHPEVGAAASADALLLDLREV
jgi:hypothetical protein